MPDCSYLRHSRWTIRVRLASSAANGRLTPLAGKRGRPAVHSPAAVGRLLGDVAGQDDEGLAGRVVRGVADGDDLAVGLDDDRLDGFVAVDGGGQDPAAAEVGVQGAVRVDPGHAEEAGAEEMRSAD